MKQIGQTLGFAVFSLFLALFPFSLEALNIITTNNINLRQTTGIIQGQVVLGQRVFGVQAMGHYANRGRTLELEITQLVRGGRIFPLTQKARATQQTPSSLWIRKGSILVFGGENKAEIAKVLGISTETYNQASNASSNQNYIQTNNASASFGNNSNASNAPTGGLGEGIDRQGVLGLDSGGSNSYTSDSVGGFSNNSFQITGGPGGLQNSKSMGPINTNDGWTNQGGMYPLPLPLDNNTDSSNLKPSSAADPSKFPYSMQYCKVPEFNPTANQLKLFIVGKDGGCQEMQAYRDDTKCNYRYDFEKGKAIKQTQFYYIDKENKIQNVGDCVDLHGDQYAMQLYRDDSKCTLNQTTEKGYGLGDSQSFQTQIVFRGMDNFLHVAVDCADYARIQNKVVRYSKDNDNKKLIPIVDQSYEDPLTHKQISLSHGTQSSLSSSYQEFACGKWVYDDANLEAHRPTMIKAYDRIQGKYVDITPCNFIADPEIGKSGQITLAYARLPEEKISETTQTTSQTFTLLWDRCIVPPIVQHLKQEWVTTYDTTTIKTKQRYQRPLQDGEDEGKGDIPGIYTVPTTKVNIKRTTHLKNNNIGLSDQYMKYVEVEKGFYKDEAIAHSEDFLKWQQTFFKPGNGACEKLESIISDKNEVAMRCSEVGDYVYENLDQNTENNKEHAENNKEHAENNKNTH
ncbi:competence protein [Helicobacter baculiformis]|uniref:Competence protein n=1 Tax=Helicobacter baculiformis TaxID=427351 RepID=A0ABV7ZJQ3_9HELI|nr:competence protein [Helicobacter baculiformis]